MIESDFKRKNSLKKFLFICLSICALTSSNFYTDQVNSEESKSEDTKEEKISKKTVDAQDILKLWEGNWQSEKTVKSSLWIKKEVKEVESKKGNWILDKRFVEIISKGEKQTTKEIHSFNQHSKKFQKFTFDTHGNTSYWTGSWNDDAKIMTWHLNFDVVKGIIVDRFSSSDNSENMDTCHTTFVMTNNDGNLLLEIDSISTRKK